MARLILFLAIILFIIWVLQPLLKTKDRNKKNELEEILDPDKSNYRQSNTIFIIISIVLLFAVFLSLLPKFGINLLSLFQKIIPLISTLRGILPF